MNKRVPPIGKADGTTFEILAERVKDVHNATSSVAKGAVNQLLTIRNWAIGCYIVEYEQEGCDRAKYGARLLQNLADKLSIKGLDRSMLSVCRLFYIRYPQICETVSHKLQMIDNSKYSISTQSLKIVENKRSDEICDSMNHKFMTPPEILLTHLSFTHIREILSIEDPIERFFYELECIKGTWSVRELHRQIDTKLYFRSGISQKPELLLQRVEKGGADAVLSIKDAYTLDFLDLNAYISYFKDCEMVDGDNPPIGILLCTEKGPKMVQYVLNGMDEKLFVSTYKLQLPDREQLENFLIKEVKEMGL
jgi:hypothetical protein